MYATGPGGQSQFREPVAARAGAPPTVSVTTSVGLAGIDPETSDLFDDAESFLRVVEQAAHAARASGADAMRVFAPALKAA